MSWHWGGWNWVLAANRRLSAWIHKHNVLTADEHCKSRMSKQAWITNVRSRLLFQLFCCRVPSVLCFTDNGSDLGTLLLEVSAVGGVRVIRQLIVLVETTTIVCYILLLTVDNPIARYLCLIVAVNRASSAYPVVWPKRIRVLEGTEASGIGIGLTNACAQFGYVESPRLRVPLLILYAAAL